jgi:menaquinone-9 beta-reductase
VVLKSRIIIVGGGLAGLVCAIRLARRGFECTLLEKKTYPFHRVCGEYISNEVTDFLKREGLYPGAVNPAQVNRLQLSASNGNATTIPLALGGFGVSRYVFDSLLADLAVKNGVHVQLGTEVEHIDFQDNLFSVKSASQTFIAELVIGSFGKRSKLDVSLKRQFIKKRSPYVGVKYHVKANHPNNVISLHNFTGGYCGISRVENNTSNLCYLVHRDYVKRYGDIKSLEENLLFGNPHLKKIFLESEFLFERPEVINEISFDVKEPVLDHVFMVGDAAGMIAPLCGNGMAMAIHSAKILSDLVIDNQSKNLGRQALENTYAHEWNKHFSKRLWMGRQIQHTLFGTPWGSRMAVNLAIHSTFIANQIVALTHGKPI